MSAFCPFLGGEGGCRFTVFLNTRASLIYDFYEEELRNETEQIEFFLQIWESIEL